MAGRPRKPTALKLITGNPGKRALNKQEPDPDYLNDLRAPEHLPDLAKKFWNSIAPKLRKERLLTELDIGALEKLCIAEMLYWEVTTKIGDSLVLNGKNGDYTNPLLNQQSMYLKQIRILYREFGKTPAARTRIALNPQGDLFNEEENPSQAKKYFA